MARSTAEAEYIAAVAAVNQALWLRKFADRFGYEARSEYKGVCRQPGHYIYCK